MPRVSRSASDEPPDSAVSQACGRRPSAKTSRFQDALGLKLQTQVFNDIKANARKMADHHFDYSYSASQQSKKSWNDYESQVCAMYPLLLNDPKKKALSYLKVYTKQHIGRMAWKYRKDNENIETENDPDFSINHDVTQNIVSPKPLRPVRAAAKCPPLANILQYHDENVTSSQSSSSSKESACSSDQIESEEPKKSLECKVTVSPLSTSPKCGSADPVCRIKDVLGSCKPPMLNLLPSLIQLGLTSDESLEGILAWPECELLSVLEKWKHAGYFTALELEALRMGLAQLKVKVKKLEA